MFIKNCLATGLLFSFVIWLFSFVSDRDLPDSKRGLQDSVVQQQNGSANLCSEVTSATEYQDPPAAKAADVSAKQKEELPLGIVKQKPSSGIFVKTKIGYMVPYRQPIAGTRLFIEMIPIPAGSFLLGSPANAKQKHDDETPQIAVTTQPFWMAKTEITWAQYKVFMDLQNTFKEFQTAGIRKVTYPAADAVTCPSILWEPEITFEAGEDDNTPAASMTQYSARQYTKWLSLLSGTFYRLPYEAEWEYSCRAGSKTIFHFGDSEDSLKDYGWYEDNSDEYRQEVASRKPNAFGLYDMHGNVAEWVLDQYEKNWYAQLKKRMQAEGLKTLTVEQTFNRPKKMFPRVLRGGSWELDSDSARSAFRLQSHDEDWTESDPNFPASPFWYSDEPAFGIGFRILRPLQAPTDAKEKAAFWDAALKQTTELVLDRTKEDGKGATGLVDKGLPKAIKDWEQKKKDRK